MKLSLVHDDFMQSGGAESLFATIASLYPKAPIYTSLVDWKKLPQSINRNRVRPSFIQKLAIAKKWYKAFLPLYPLAFERFDFDDYDLVISSTTRFAKSAITKPGTIHICYINSTPRFLWDENVKKEYLPSILRFLFSLVLKWLKRWDKAASARADFYIANSKNVKDRVKKYYNRESDVIYPFADINFFKPAAVHNWQLKSRNYFLVVSRLVKWKKIEIAIHACSDLGKNLIIVGDGPDAGRLKSLASRHQIPDTTYQIQFLGKVTREELRDLYRNSEALIVTQEEDFGIASVEAQACGTPVIAYDSGGQQEIIESNKTGILFKNQTAEDLKDAILAFLKVKWGVQACRKNSLKFSQANFEKNIKKFVGSKVNSNF